MKIQMCSARLIRRTLSSDIIAVNAKPMECPMSSKRTYRLNDDAIRAIREIQRLMKQDTSHQPEIEELLAFNPESDENQPGAEARMLQILGDIADVAKVPRDIAYAIRKTGLVVTDENKDFLDIYQRAVWNQAVEEYDSLYNRKPM